MVETQSGCFCRIGSPLNPSLIPLTPPAEPSVLKLSFDIQDRNGYSLPPYQTPMVLPLKSVGFLMPVSARPVSSRPDFLKVGETLPSAPPSSRAAGADGIQSTTTSAPPPAITCGGATSGPPGLIVTSSPASVEKAFSLATKVSAYWARATPF